MIGLLFLVNNVWPEVSLWSLAWNYWPLLLILLGVIGLVEALYQAARGVPNPSRPFGGAWIFWVVIFITFFNWTGGNIGNHFVPFANGGIHILGTDYTYPITQNSVASGVTRVVLDNLHGTLSLRGDQGNEVKVAGHKTVRAFSREEADQADRQSPLRVDRDGDRLIVSVTDPKGSNMLSVSSDLDITIPRGLDVEISGRNGDLTVDDIAGSLDIAGRGEIRLTNIGKDVRIESTRGLIRATDLKGKLDVKGSGGDVQIENVADEVTVHGEYGGTLEFHALAKSLHFISERSDFHAEAVPGNVTFDSGDMKMSNVVGPVRFKTGTRDITVMDVTNGLEIAVQRGDIDMTQTKLPLPKMDVHTHSGNVTLAIPEQSAFDLDGRTAHGDATNDFGDPLKADDQGHAATIRGKQGAAGPDIQIGTDRGNVTVRKS
jgi:DUF4097 and DUF4098 domain-containing protein YvlB